MNEGDASSMQMNGSIGIGALRPVFYISLYVTPDGSDGGYQFERRVYARKGEPCVECSEPIRRIVLGQRSSHYCPNCQK